MSLSALRGHGASKRIAVAGSHRGGWEPWTTAPATSSLVGWPRRSSPSRPRTRRGSPSTGRPPPARPRWPTSSPSSCAARGREVIRSSIESFLLPRAQRYRRGEYSAEGCYHDSFDFDALHRVLLDPLGPGGDRRFQQAVYDRDTDTALSPPVTTAAADARAALRRRVPPAPGTDRPVGPAHLRVRRVRGDPGSRPRSVTWRSLGSATEVERRFRNRYLPSQQHYFDTVRPTDLADIVVHNDEPERPAWEARPR